MRQTEPQTAGRILALLEQIGGDQRLLDSLTVHDFGNRGTEDFHVSRWQEQWRKGRDLWRLKAWDLERQGLQYRIVYAYLPGKLKYFVLAIAPREFDYDATHPIGQRILHAYQELQDQCR
ncbi:MAG: hypothetical protein ACXIUM_14560 [Wenzhouxiangella sp.]